MDCSPPGSSVHGISQARITEVVCHFLLQENFLTQGAKLHLLHWQALACRFFISEPPGNALVALACTDVSSLGDEYRPWTSILQQMVRPTIYVVEVDSPYHQSLVSISLPFRVLTSSLEESWSFPQQCPTDGNIWFFFPQTFSPAFKLWNFWSYRVCIAVSLWQSYMFHFISLMNTLTYFRSVKLVTVIVYL